MITQVPWKALKTFLTLHSVAVQGTEDEDNYYLYAINGQAQFSCLISKLNKNDDLAEFETTYKPVWNPNISPKDLSGRPITTMSAFGANIDYEIKATGFRGTATAGTTTALNFSVGAEDRHINGLRLILKNHVDGDTVGFQVVDVDNVLGYGAGVVLKTFGITWNVDDTVSDQGRDTYNFVARIPAGIYIRVNYVSTGATNVVVKVNCYLQKKL